MVRLREPFSKFRSFACFRMILSMLSLYYLTWGPNNLKIFSPSSLRKRSKKEKSAELVVVCCSKRINKKALEAQQAFLPCFFLNFAKIPTMLGLEDGCHERISICSGK